MWINKDSAGKWPKKRSECDCHLNGVLACVCVNLRIVVRAILEELLHFTMPKNVFLISGIGVSTRRIILATTAINSRLICQQINRITFDANNSLIDGIQKSCVSLSRIPIYFFVSVLFWLHESRASWVRVRVFWDCSFQFTGDSRH